MSTSERKSNKSFIFLLGMIVIPIVIMSGTSAGILQMTSKKFSAASYDVFEHGYEESMKSYNEYRYRLLKNYFDSTAQEIGALGGLKSLVESVKLSKLFKKKLTEEIIRHPQLIKDTHQAVASYYKNQYTPEYLKVTGVAPDIEKIMASMDDASVAMQYATIVNPSKGWDEISAGQGFSDGFRKLLAEYRSTKAYIDSYVKYLKVYDFMLIDPETGDVVYSLSSKTDYAHSVLKPLYKEDGLGQSFQKTLKNSERGLVHFVDYQPYAAAFQKPVAFVSTALWTHDQMVGVVVVQLPLDHLGSLMSERTGLGETGESYLVGADALLRSDTRLAGDKYSVVSSMLKPDSHRLDTEAVKSGIEGHSGVIHTKNYNGQNTLTAYQPIDVLGSRWICITEITEDELNQKLTSLEGVSSGAMKIMLTSIVFSIVLTAILIYIAWFFASRYLQTPISNMLAAVEKAVQGDLTSEINSKNNDEMGLMVQSFASLLDHLRNTIGNIKNQTLEVSKSAYGLTDIVTHMAQESLRIDGEVNAVAGTTSEMSANVNRVASAVEESSSNIRNVASAVEEISSNLKAVAQSAQEMTSSVAQVMDSLASMNKVAQSVAEHSEKASGVVSRATKVAKGTSEAIDGLGKSADEIGRVVSLISDIADKTNLLALNATIEAASAGEAGRGFSVVANEVKELAKQTARATEEIRQKVEGIQASTHTSVSAIGEIVKIVDEVNVIAGAITHAVMEQKGAAQAVEKAVNSAATAAEVITRNSQEAAIGANEVARNAEELSQGTNEIARSAAGVATGTEELSRAIKAVSHSMNASTKDAQSMDNVTKQLAGLAHSVNGLISRFTT